MKARIEKLIQEAAMGVSIARDKEKSAKVAVDAAKADLQDAKDTLAGKESELEDREGDTQRAELLLEDLRKALSMC